jgi:hypothetical protein
MFAAWLRMYDEANNERWRLCSAIEYEPDWSKVGDYVFDFARHFVKLLFIGPALFVDLVEYKPGGVTDAYIQEWGMRCKVSKSRFTHAAELSFCLYEGNFWSGESRLFRYRHTDSEGTSLFYDMGPWIDAATAERIRQIRFDLKGGV